MTLLFLLFFYFTWVCTSCLLRKKSKNDLYLLSRREHSVCVCELWAATDRQQSCGKSSLYLSPVLSVVIIFTLTELMCFEPISFIRAIKLFRAWKEKTEKNWSTHSVLNIVPYDSVTVCFFINTHVLSPFSSSPSRQRWSSAAACWRTPGCPGASAADNQPEGRQRLYLIILKD